MSRFYSVKLLGAAVFVGGLLAAGGIAQAQTTQTTDESCFLAPAKLSAAEVDGFLADPSKLLKDEPAGGLPLANKARSLGGSSFKAASALVELTKGATAEQKAAIGSGLSRAAQACGTSNPDYASKLQQIVASLGDPAVITAFMSASGDVQVAAVGGGAGGGAGGAGAGGGAGGGSTSSITQRAASNGARFGGNETISNSGSYSVGDAGSSYTTNISGVTD